MINPRTYRLRDIPGSFAAAAAVAAVLLFVVGATAPAARAQAAACTASDQDCDGIPDQVETELLARFTPYLRYSRDNGDNETFRPADITAYLATADVGTSGTEGKDLVLKAGALTPNPSVLLGLSNKGISSNLVNNQNKTAYHVNPNNQKGRPGVPWTEALAKKNVGLYGHVVPIYLSAAENYNYGKVTTPGDQSGILFYKIEYWQFFGYSSDDKPLDVGDHEGDWDTVQLLYQPGNPKTGQTGGVKTVMFYAHGKQMRFDLSAAVGSPLPIAVNGQPAIELRGIDYAKPVPNLNDWGGSEPARNHVLQLYKDPQTGEFCHPVVYVEHGGHEFWPSPAWKMIGAQKHGGDDVKDSYLAATPPNAGEVEHPLKDDPTGVLILQFNGYWGTYSRALPHVFENNPPPGPPLHFEWTYPWNQRIRPATNAQEY